MATRISKTRIGFAILCFSIVAIAAWLFWPKQSLPVWKPRYTTDANHQVFQFEESTDREELSFRIDWPPKSRAAQKRMPAEPLLHGMLVVESGQHEENLAINIRIEITRDETQSARERWGERLAFPEFDWMSRVRVWDAEEKWLWPNLPYLLRAYGVQREQRYGGVDPGKGIDNDFAAVVVQPLMKGTESRRLISAEWYAPPIGTIHKRSIVHRAISQDLLWTFPNSSAGADESNIGRTGQLGVWLIYADFLGYRPPREWPDELEYNGGALAFFRVHWERDQQGNLEVKSITNEVPPKTTGVDWKIWQAENIKSQ